MSDTRRAATALGILIIIAISAVAILELTTSSSSTPGLYTGSETVNTATLPPPTEQTTTSTSSTTTVFGGVAYTYNLCTRILSPGNVSGSNGGTGCFLQPDGVLFDPDNGLVYVSHAGNITVINATSDSFVANIADDLTAEQMVYDGALNLIYASNYLSLGTTRSVALVSVINAVTNQVETNITVGSDGSNEINEWGIALDPANGDVYVAVYCDVGKCNNGNVSVISTSTNTVIKTITGFSRCTGAGSCVPSAVFYDPASGLIYVGHQYSSNITLINPAVNAQDGTIDLTASAGTGASPVAFAYDSKNGFVYAADEATSEITVINGTTNRVNETIGAYQYTSNGGYFTGGQYNGQEPWGLAVDSSSNYLYAANYGSGNVTVIDCTRNQVVGWINVGVAPRGIAYDSMNGYLYVANHFGDTVSIILT